MSKDKEDKLFDNFISKKQLQALESLKIRIQSAKASIEILERKIKAEGLNGFYSSNHDILKYAHEIWRECSRLCDLRTLKDEHENRE